MASEGKDSKSSSADIKSVEVPTTRITDSTVFYVINVKAGSKWSVIKRYNQFKELHTKLSTDLSKHIPVGCDLPPQKWKMFTSHRDPAFVEERRCLLESYLKKLLNVPELANSDVLKSFLSSDKDAEYHESDDAKELPEDVEVTGVTIPATRTMSDHVLYQIDVVNSRKRKTFSKWTVLKRFQQFYDMDSAMRASFVTQPELLAQLPPPPARKPKLFNDHLDDTFVEQRRALLENYLQKLMQIEQVVRNQDFLGFLGVSV